jgi:hypothetical protein
MISEPERLSLLTQRYETLQAATDVTRFLALKAMLGTGSNSPALEEFAHRYPRSPFTVQLKAAVPPAMTTSPGWAGALLPPSADPILAVVQKQTLPGRLALRKVDFNIPAPVQSSLGTYYWVQQGKPKPATQIDFTSVTNPPGKIGGIVPVSRELVKFVAAGGGEGVLQSAITGGLIAFVDKQFLDPAIALVVNDHPASITNGVTPITATGTTLADKAREVLAALFAARPQTQRPVLIGTAGALLGLGDLDAALRLANVSVFPSPAAGSLLIAADAAGIIVSDGGLELDVSEEATVLMDTAPVEDALAIPRSFWQTNLVGFRAELMTWWQKADATVVQVVATS